MKWVNVTVYCYDDVGMVAASLTGDLPFVFHSLQASYNNKSLPRMSYESLVNGELQIAFAQACTDKMPDHVLLCDWKISVKSFLELPIDKFVRAIYKNCQSHFSPASALGVYFERYKDDKVLKEYSENE